MKYDITPELAELFTRKAEAMGYSVVKEKSKIQDLKLLFTVFKGDQEVCRFEKTGAMRFWSNSPFMKEREDLHGLLLDLKNRYELYLNASPLNCDGVRDFRLISEFGNHVLAAKLSKDNEIRFTTWEYTYDRTGVTHGHYFETNYQGAIKEFAARSGLIDSNQIFTEEEMAVLYTSCVFRGQHDEGLTFEEEHKLHDIIGKLEINFPQETLIQAHIQEQEDEHGI